MFSAYIIAISTSTLSRAAWVHSHVCFIYNWQFRAANYSPLKSILWIPHTNTTVVRAGLHLAFASITCLLHSSYIRLFYAKPGHLIWQNIIIVINAGITSISKYLDVESDVMKKVKERFRRFDRHEPDQISLWEFLGLWSSDPVASQWHCQSSCPWSVKFHAVLSYKGPVIADLIGMMTMRNQYIMSSLLSETILMWQSDGELMSTFACSKYNLFPTVAILHYAPSNIGWCQRELWCITKL